MKQKRRPQELEPPTTAVTKTKDILAHSGRDVKRERYLLMRFLIDSALAILAVASLSVLTVGVLMLPVVLVFFP